MVVINKKTKRVIYLFALLFAVLSLMGVQQITTILAFSIGPIAMKFIIALALIFIFFDIFNNKIV